jgi:hypothetical protein
VELAATGMKPESNPPSCFAHGSAKLDWVTVWFCNESYEYHAAKTLQEGRANGLKIDDRSRVGICARKDMLSPRTTQV